MTEPMTPERLAECRAIESRLTNFGQRMSYVARTDAAEAMRDLRAEVDRLRAQVAAVRNACADRKSGGSPLFSGREVLALLDRAALASGEEVQHG